MSERYGNLGIRFVLFLAAIPLIVGCATKFAATANGQSPAVPAAESVEPTADEIASLTAVEQRITDVYRRMNRGVVNVHTVSVAYSRFLLPYPLAGAGSGSIIDDGVVLTNHHVIAGADRVFVALFDGEPIPATVIGADPENDLALLRFDPGERDLTIVPIGISARLQVGQIVVAMGNPFGLDRTLTLGVISSVARPLQSETGVLLLDLIQTDAAINPGNSGGPLFDLNGNMIGVNTMIVSPGGGSVGLGFAISADTVMRIIPTLYNEGRIDRGWIELDPVPIMPVLAARAKLPVSRGILVSDVAPRGNAAAAGIIGGKKGTFVVYGRKTIYLGGDIITEVAGKPVGTLSEYMKALETTAPGDLIELTLLRGTQTLKITVELVGRPAALRW